MKKFLIDSFYQEMLEISPEFMKKFQHDFKVSPTALLYPRCIIIVEQTPKTVTKLNGHLLNILQFFFSILSWKFCLRRYQIYLSLKLTSGPLEFMKFGQICYCFQNFDYGTPTQQNSWILVTPGSVYSRGPKSVRAPYALRYS